MMPEKTSTEDGEKKTRSLALIMANQRLKWVFFSFSFLPLATFLYVNQYSWELVFYSWQTALLLLGFPAVAITICILQSLPMPKLPFAKRHRRARREAVMEAVPTSPVCSEKRFVGYLRGWAKPSFPDECLKCVNFLACVEKPKHESKNLRRVVVLVPILPVATVIVWYAVNKILTLI